MFNFMEFVEEWTVLDVNLLRVKVCLVLFDQVECMPEGG